MPSTILAALLYKASLEASTTNDSWLQYSQMYESTYKKGYATCKLKLKYVLKPQAGSVKKHVCEYHNHGAQLTVSQLTS